MKNIFAYTPAGIAPPFVSLNQMPDLSYVLTVRGQAVGGACGPTIEIPIPAPELAKASDAIHEHLNP